MKLKIVEVAGVKYSVLDDKGFPVYVHDDGKEIGFDAPAAMKKIGELNSEAKDHRLAAKEANDKLKQFEGIEDPAAAKKALQFAQTLEGKKVMDDESIKRLVESAVKPLQEENSTLKQTIEGKDGHIYRLEVSNRFASSAFLKEKTIYGETPDMAEAYFGKHFKIENGKVIAQDAAGNQIYSKVKPGEPADFEEAISILVESHPKKDHLLKAKGAAGSGAQGDRNKGDFGAVKSRADLKTDTEKSAFITQHGLDAFKQLPTA
jgi:hypothetical protein